MTQQEKIDFAVMNEQVKSCNDQLKRMVSHIESEQRVTGNISKRVELNDSAIQRIHSAMDRYERILLNDGKGLALRVDRLEQLLRNQRDGFRWNFGTIISIVAIVISAITLFTRI